MSRCLQIGLGLALLVAVAASAQEIDTRVLVDDSGRLRISELPDILGEIHNAHRTTTELFRYAVALSDQRIGMFLRAGQQLLLGKTLKTTSRAYILEKGKIVLDGSSEDLANDDHVRKIYLGH